MTTSPTATRVEFSPFRFESLTYTRRTDTGGHSYRRKVPLSLPMVLETIPYLWRIRAHFESRGDDVDLYPVGEGPVQERYDLATDSCSSVETTRGCTRVLTGL